MISEAIVRRWYTPVEVSTLRRWLVVSFVVNLLLLSVDLLRGGTTTVLLGLVGLGLIAALFNAGGGLHLVDNFGDNAVMMATGAGNHVFFQYFASRAPFLARYHNEFEWNAANHNASTIWRKTLALACQARRAIEKVNDMHIARCYAAVGSVAPGNVHVIDLLSGPSGLASQG